MEVIVHDRMPIFEMPACLYTVLQQSTSAKAEKHIKHMRETTLVAAYRELEMYPSTNLLSPRWRN
jgi:hypothetical protein